MLMLVTINASYITAAHYLRSQILKICSGIGSSQRACLIAQLVKNPPAMQETPVRFHFGLGRSAGEGIGYLLQYYWTFPCGSADKESVCNARNLDLISGLGRSPGEGKGYLLQYSGLENSMNV